MATYSSKKYPSGSVTSAQLADGTVVAVDLADGAVTSAKLNSTVDLSGKTVTYRSIVAGDIASNAITTAKINDAAVSHTKMANAGAELGMRNRIINGAMVIDQRNGSGEITSAGNVYTVDRFLIQGSQTGKFNVQQVTDAPAGFTNSLKVTVATPVTVGSSDYFILRQPIEGNNVADLGFGTANASAVTLSFWVKSSLTGLRSGHLTNSASNRWYAYTYTISASNTWEYKTITIPGDTSGTWLKNNEMGIYVGWSLGTGSTNAAAGSNTWSSSTGIGAPSEVNTVATSGATFLMTGVQLEKGSNATPFEYRSYDTELRLCHRYAAILYGGTYGGFNISSTTFGLTIALPAPMRTQPSFTTNISDSNFVVAGPNANQWAMYVQNSGYNSYSGSINTLSVNSGQVSNPNWVQIGTYGITLNSFTGFLLGSARYFSFIAEL